ncbi:chemotaxis protein CheW [Haliangium ochraceum]|uniref:CheW protein n=1 Tax=Haliangium ochraceum (strain DSM 14365 / JCM 11303 / SMP-2) TaxID=502025 RepID=D0LTR3_HALO1|nr:chemotaxis protein CheW [Haliangium ochraceum]ACY15757.1 CheW protein [Haliangium ochraceum DSM 14365]
MSQDHLSDEERARLATRAQQLAQPEARFGRGPTFTAAEILVAGERFAIEALLVHGVAGMSRLAPLPHAPAHVAGLIARNGDVLPAFHLHAVLELPLTALPEYSRVLLLGERGPELALVVENVVGVGEVRPDTLTPMPEAFSVRQRRLLRGLRPDGVPVLDGAALLADERLFIDIDLDRLRDRSEQGETA